jgi:hypothetical protein
VAVISDVARASLYRAPINLWVEDEAEFDADLAKEIGAWQRQNNAVPPDLVVLLQSLQLRIARPPSSR